MPNWVHCTFEISGDKKDLNILKGKISNNEILNSLFPTPLELVQTQALFHSEDQLTDQEKSNIEKYGAQNWYIWNCRNWGTKWGDCYTELLEESETLLVYDTSFAWCLPYYAMERISSENPTLIFRLGNVSEETRSFSGEITFQNGFVIDDKIVEDLSDEDVDLNRMPWKYRIDYWFSHYFWLLRNKVNSFLIKHGLIKVVSEEIPF